MRAALESTPQWLQPLYSNSGFSAKYEHSAYSNIYIRTNRLFGSSPSQYDVWRAADSISWSMRYIRLQRLKRAIRSPTALPVASPRRQRACLPRPRLIPCYDLRVDSSFWQRTSCTNPLSCQCASVITEQVYSCEFVQFNRLIFARFTSYFVVPFSSYMLGDISCTPCGRLSAKTRCLWLNISSTCARIYG